MQEQHNQQGSVRHKGTGPAAEVVTLPRAKEVANAIRDMIIQDQIKPGEPIRERILSEKFGISRTPLRESLRMLAAEGLVDLIANRGAVAANPTAQETYDRLMVLGALEGLAGELAAKAATDSQIAELIALNFEMRAAQARRDRLAYFKINQEIHLAIVEISGNESLRENYWRINAQVYRARYRNNFNSEEWDHSMDEHDEIIEALKARDPERLSSILRGHLRPICQTLLAELQEID